MLGSGFADAGKNRPVDKDRTMRYQGKDLVNLPGGRRSRIATFLSKRSRTSGRR
jgi:hypothetical protein